MKKVTLSLHKKAPKVLSEMPSFLSMKRGKLPKPLHEAGGPRASLTQLIPVGGEYVAWFMWRDGETIEQTAFYAYLFSRISENTLYPLCHFHWHPSHKSLHMKTPCGSDLNYTNRGLPGALELQLKCNIDKRFDHRLELDRIQLVQVFCDACGINFGRSDLLCE
jgi:hypothetical protein